MRSYLRIVTLMLVLLALVIPLGTYASGGPCPDDPEAFKNCYDTAPPYFVVTNRAFEDLNRPGSGCQPFILKHPDCEDCTNTGDPDCSAIDVDVELCQDYLAANNMPEGDVVEMCCNCVNDPNGQWVYRMRYFDGTSCPDPGDWEEGLPPGTGIDLPAPVIVGGLALIGAGLLAAGLLVRRRTLQTA